MRSPSFSDLRQMLEDYADNEGQEPVEVLMELMEHFVPGIEELADDCTLLLEKDLN